MYVLGGSGSRLPSVVQISFFQRLSARSITYGIQPICPSAKHTRRLGWRANAPENNQSESDITEVMNTRMAVTAGGPSADEVIQCEPQPMCMKLAIPRSL